MITPILTSKLYIAPPIQNLVPRLRLIDRLNEGVSKKLILLSAPAGFGKSTLLSSWVAQQGSSSRITWLTLDERDNDLVRFISYFIAALQKIEPDIGSGLISAMNGHSELNPEIILTNLLNEIALLLDDVILILDDYHVIDSNIIDQSITFLLDHLPSQFHLVISSRIDPSLPIPRLLARGQMLEIRANDLRFSSAEAANFLNQVMGLDLGGDDLATLEVRTEGWIAGLHLAALSMQSHEDVHEFIRSFAGSNRYILDYLGEEVLAHQAPASQEFLLKTSILKRFNAALCDELLSEPAVSPNLTSQDVLEYLDANNIFIEALDDERHWYRYHHLFADLLQHHLQRQLPESAGALHSKASRWYEINKFPDDAIFHAFQAEDKTKAAEIIGENAITTLTNGGVYTVKNWLGQLPEDLIRSKPELCLAKCWQSYVSGQFDIATYWLDILENNVGFPEQNKLNEVDLSDLPNPEIWEALATLRSTIFAWQGKAQLSIEVAGWALEKIRPGNPNYRCILEWNLAFSSRLVGNLMVSEKAYLRAIQLSKTTGNSVTVLNATVGLAQLYRVLGQLEKAENTFLDAFELGNEYRISYSVALGSAHIGLATVLCQMNRLDEARIHFKQGDEIAEKWGSLDLVKAKVCEYRLQLALGDLQGAQQALDRAIFLAEGLGQDFRGGIARLFRVRLWLLQGEFDKAVDWLHQESKYDPDDLSELNEFRGITQARVMFATGKFNESLELLDRVFINTEMVGRLEHAIEVRIIKAQTFEGLQEPEQALMYLNKALEMAEAHGFVRIFIDENPKLEPLLSKVLQSRSTGKESRVSITYIEKILSNFGAENPSHDPILAEELSPRELEILKLISIGLSNKEISERLFLSINTIKGYNHTIFGKLGVQNRTEAANRVRELGII